MMDCIELGSQFSGSFLDEFDLSWLNFQDNLRIADYQIWRLEKIRRWDFRPKFFILQF